MDAWTHRPRQNVCESAERKTCKTCQTFCKHAKHRDVTCSVPVALHLFEEERVLPQHPRVLAWYKSTPKSGRRTRVVQINPKPLKIRGVRRNPGRTVRKMRLIAQRSGKTRRQYQTTRGTVGCSTIADEPRTVPDIA
eukprot:1046672-Rhodomonas_salina.2